MGIYRLQEGMWCLLDRWVDEVGIVVVLCRVDIEVLKGFVPRAIFY